MNPAQKYIEAENREDWEELEEAFKALPKELQTIARNIDNVVLDMSSLINAKELDEQDIYKIVTSAKFKYFHHSLRNLRAEWDKTTKELYD